MVDQKQNGNRGDLIRHTACRNLPSPRRTDRRRSFCRVCVAPAKQTISCELYHLVYYAPLHTPYNKLTNCPAVQDAAARITFPNRRHYNPVLSEICVNRSSGVETVPDRPWRQSADF